MKVTFFSNFLNDHQLSLSLSFYGALHDDYRFVATAPMWKERIEMGFEEMNKQYPFVITTYDSQENERIARDISVSSDVVIVGSAPDIYISERLKKDKLTFKYSERFFKKGLSFPRLPKEYLSARKHITRFQKYPFYYLCSSAYTAADVNRFSDYEGRTFKWGYFPEVRYYDNANTLISAKEPSSILWVGRLIGLKHPDAPILVAKKLKENGYSFKLNMIGGGGLESKLKQMIQRYELGGCVHMLGVRPPAAVREYMERAGIFLFTSDFNEGWGAVLNESMNSGCAVVASHAIGSVPFLIENGENGFIYENGNVDDLYTKVKWLLDHPERQKDLGRQAYRTMIEQWNASNASKRFLRLAQDILEGNPSPNLYADGVCSRAEILRNDWWATI